MPSDWSAALAIGLVVVLTYGSRVAGALLMTRVGASDRVQRFLDGLSISVIAALVASILVRAGPREAVSVGVASLTMLVTRNSLVAIAAGVACAAGWRYVELHGL